MNFQLSLTVSEPQRKRTGLALLEDMQSVILSMGEKLVIIQEAMVNVQTVRVITDGTHQ